jgi:hypothetical protein
LRRGVHGTSGNVLEEPVQEGGIGAAGETVVLVAAENGSLHVVITPATCARLVPRLSRFSKPAVSVRDGWRGVD